MLDRPGRSGSAHLVIARSLLAAIFLTYADIVGASGGSAASELVVPSEMCGPRFIIEVEVDGREPGSRVKLKALFDSGGAQLSIDPRTVARIWDRKVSHGEPVKLDNAVAGPMHFGRFRPRAWSMAHLSRLLGLEIDLFISFRQFRNVLLTLDFPRRQMRIAEGRLPAPDDVEIFDASGPDKRPYLRVAVGDGERLLMIDSGASGALYLRDEGSLQWSIPPIPISATQGMESVTFHDVGRLAGDVEIAGVRIETPIAAIRDGSELLGLEIMRHFAWTFDRASRRVRVRPSSTEPIELASRRGTGVVLTPEDAGYRIARVLPGSPAAEAEMQVGDLIVTRDGNAVYSLGCERWDESTREQVTFGVERDGRSFDVTVPIVALVP